jgi:phenylacetic acid degradation operon negative regulatory protein
MTTTSAGRKLGALISSFERRRPMRAGSLIVTVYGDAVVPRGGSLWLGSLLDMMAGFGVEPGLVRTAVSRLVAEGLFERSRIGKQSYYRLSEPAAREFAIASSHIYRTAERPWSGELELAVITSANAADRAEHRERMLREGYGQLAANVTVRPYRDLEWDNATKVPDLIFLVTRPPGADDVRALARACWQLEALAALYRGFLEAYGPVAGAVADGATLSDVQAFQLRTLMVHDWRRIVLRDPLLPPAMLPVDWPGLRALDLVSGAYRRLLPASERWLDHHAVREDGPLPPAVALADRFRTA